MHPFQQVIVKFPLWIILLLILLCNWICVILYWIGCDSGEVWQSNVTKYLPPPFISKLILYYTVRYYQMNILQVNMFPSLVPTPHLRLREEGLVTSSRSLGFNYFISHLPCNQIAENTICGSPCRIRHACIYCIQLINNYWIACESKHIDMCGLATVHKLVHYSDKVWQSNVIYKIIFPSPLHLQVNTVLSPCRRRHGSTYCSQMIL